MRYPDNSYDGFKVPWGWVSFFVVIVALAVLGFFYIKKDLKER